MRKRTDVFEQIRLQIREEELLKTGDRVIVGVSGGADSVFLLHILARLRDEGMIALWAVHVHHGIRGAEADGDARFVREICEELGVPCHVEYMDVPGLAAAKKLTLEEAGRKARYACFRQEMERVGANRLAVAHHRNDCAETILFHLVRGTGIKGLCGIAPVQGEIVRPLLGLGRTDIETELRDRGIVWRTDSTNDDLQYSRNRIRTTLIPWLERELNPDAAEHITAAAQMLREIDDHMEREATDWLEGESEHGLDAARLAGASTALQGYLIRRRLAEGAGLKDISREHVEAVRGLLAKPVGKTVCLPGGRRVRRDYDKLVFFTEAEQDSAENASFRVAWREISREIFEKIPFDPYTKCFDYDKIKGNLCLRTRKTGDRIAVFSDGRTQSVKEYMINARIPARQREQIPLLLCGDEVLWIVGYRASETFRVTGETHRILLVTAEKGTKEDEEEIK